MHTVREDRQVDSVPKRLAAKAFYAVMRRWVLPELPEDAGDFKGFNRRVLETLKQYKERVRFLRGAFATMGYRQTEVGFRLRKILRFARDAIVSNTALPLRLAVYLGSLTWAALAIFVAVCGGIQFLGTGLQQPLIMLVIGLILGFSGLLLLFVGLIGEYLKVIILEVKQRPLYIVKALYNLTPPPN